MNAASPLRPGGGALCRSRQFRSLLGSHCALVTFTGILRVTISLRKRHGPLGAKLSRPRNRHSVGTFPVLFCAVARYAFLCF